MDHNQNSMINDHIRRHERLPWLITNGPKGSNCMTILDFFMIGCWKNWPLSRANRELKQERQRRLWKRHFNSSNVGNFFWSRILKDCIWSSGKEKESCCPVFPSSTKREIRHFHVVVVQRRLRNVQKSVMHVQSCCFANLTYLVAVALFGNTL